MYEKGEHLGKLKYENVDEQILYCKDHIWESQVKFTKKNICDKFSGALQDYI